MKKPTRIILTSLPIIATVGGVGTYFAYQMKKGSDDTPKQSYSNGMPRVGEHTPHPNSVYSKYKVFPELTSNQFYKYIRIVNKKPIITNQLISRVVDEVIKKTNISDGTISWGYQLNDTKDNLLITFKWNSGSQTKVFSKTYKFNLTNGV